MRDEIPKPGHRPGAPWQRTCPYCGVDIRPEQAVHPGHCGTRTCRNEHLVAIVAIQEVAASREEAEYQAAVRATLRDAEPDIAALAEAASAQPSDVAVAVVPHQNERIVPLSASRRTAFLTHLSRTLSDVFSDPKPDPDPELDRDVAENRNKAAAEAPVISLACRTCQGHCCRIGASQNAFLSKSELRMMRLRHPDMSEQDFLTYWEAALPEATVEQSCVFHGDRGCVLPREMRANTCNRFHCRSIEMLKALHAEDPEALVAVVGRVDGEARAVSGYREGQGAWIHRPPDPPAAHDEEEPGPAGAGSSGES